MSSLIEKVRTKRIESYKVKEGVRLICREAFENCKNLRHIELPSSLNFIGENAFRGCVKLNEITLPKSLIYIGDGAFCCELQDIIDDYESRLHPLKISIPSSVEFIDGNPFGYNSIINCNNERFKVIDNVLYSKDGKKLISCCYNKNDVFSIPNGVQTIGKNAFRNNPIKKVILPPTLKVIDEYAFYGATCRESEIIFPESLEEIHDEAFGGFVFFHNGCVAFPSNILSISKNAFDFDTEIKLIKVPKGRIEYFKSILPDEISYKICDEDVQFENGLYLNTDKTELISVFSLEKNLIIPDGITTIKDRAISFRFDSITLPASLKDFSSNMFDSRASIWGDKYLMVKQLFVPLGTKEYFSMRLPQYKDVIWEY